MNSMVLSKLENGSIALFMGLHSDRLGIAASILLARILQYLMVPVWRCIGVWIKLAGRRYSKNPMIMGLP